MISWLPADPSLRAPGLPSLRLRTDGTALRDALGRQVLLRGVNAGGGAKLPPFFPFAFVTDGEASFDAALAAYLEPVTAWGFNVLRLPFPWEAVEPEPGRDDAVYLERLERFVGAAAARGLRVILDAHQDLFARAYGGDGFPAWAAKGPSRRGPLCGAALWGAGYFVDRRVRRDFDRFWSNAGGLQDAFAAMWRRVAGRFAGVDAVVGFELLNEPAPGTTPLAEWSRRVLPDFHARLGDEVHRAAPEALLFFGTSGVEAIAARTDTTLPRGGPWVFAPHHYDAARLLLAFVGASPLGALLGRYDAAAPLGAWRAYGDAWDVPVLLGELGIPARAWGAAAHLRETYRALDLHGLSATVWEYSTRAEDWNHEGLSLADPGGAARPVALAVSRPYPAAIAGELEGHAFAPEARRLEVRWHAGPGTSELCWPRHLGARLQLSAAAPLRWCHDETAGRVLVQTLAPGPVAVRLEPVS